MQTVVVTSANARLGKILLPRLQQAGYSTTALVRHPQNVDGADHIISEWTTSSEAQLALETADMIVHLSGEWSSRTQAGYDAANVQTTERVATALRTGRVRRVIFLSYLGADASSDNWFLSAKGRAENLLRASGKEAVIFRCPSIINTPEQPTDVEANFISHNGKAVMMIGSGQQRWRPVLQADVVTAILTALAGGRAGIYELTGLEEMSADEVIRTVNQGRNVPIRHIPAWAARLFSRFTPDLPTTTVNMLLGDMTGNPEPALREFGFTLTSTRKTWASSVS